MKIEDKEMESYHNTTQSNREMDRRHNGVRKTIRSDANEEHTSIVICVQCLKKYSSNLVSKAYSSKWDIFMSKT